MSKVDEVKEILAVNVTEAWYADKADKVAHQIDKLYQPDDDPDWAGARHYPELSDPQPDELISDEEIADIEEAVEDAVFSGQATDTKPVAVAKAQLAHCKPIIEARLLSQDGVKQSVESIIKREVGLAEARERERILALLNARDVGGVNPEWAMSDKQYKSLKGADNGHIE